MSDFRRCCLGTDELVRTQCMSVVWICWDVLCFLHSWDNHRNMANVFKQFPICPKYFPIFPKYFPIFPKYFPIFPNISQTCPKYVWFPVLSTHHGAWMSHPAAGCLGIPWEPAILAMYSSERHTHIHIYIYILFYIILYIYIYTIRFFKLCECLYIYIQLIIYIAWSTSNIAGLLFGSPWQSPPFLLYTARLFRHVLMALFMAESSSQNLRRSILTCPTNWMGSLIPSHMLHVWYIYLHLGDF